MSSIWNLKSWFGKDWALETTSLRSLSEERVDLDNRARRLLRDLSGLEEEKLRLEEAYVEACREDQFERKELIAHECRKVEWELEQLPVRYGELVQKAILLRECENIKEEVTQKRRLGSSSVFSHDLAELKPLLVGYIAHSRNNADLVDDMVDVLRVRNDRPQDAAFKAVRRRLDDLATQRLTTNEEDSSTIDVALEEIDRQLDAMNTSQPICGKAVL